MGQNSSSSLNSVKIYENLIFYNQTTRYALLSAVTGLGYDILLNLGDEINLIWRSSWSFPKLLYIISRYYHLAYLAFYVRYKSFSFASISTCRRGYFFTAFGGDVLMTSVINVILVLRVSALYGHSRRVIICLVALCAVVFSLQCAIDVYVVTNTIILTPDIFSTILKIPFIGCTTGLKTLSILPMLEARQIVLWSATLCSELIMFVMMIVRTRQDFSKQGSPSAPVSFWIKFNNIVRQPANSPLLASLYVDGTIHLGIMIVIVAFNILSATINYSNYTNTSNAIFFPWYFAFYSITGSRLILNLRRISFESGGSLGTSISAPIQFNMFQARARTFKSEGEDELEASVC